MNGGAISPRDRIVVALAALLVFGVLTLVVPVVAFGMAHGRCCSSVVFWSMEMEILLLILRFGLAAWGIAIGVRRARISLPLVILIAALIAAEFAPPLIIKPTVSRTLIYDAEEYFTHDSIAKASIVKRLAYQTVRSVSQSTTATLEDVKSALLQTEIPDPYIPGDRAQIAFEGTEAKARVRDKDCTIRYDPTNGVHSKGFVEYAINLKR